MTALTSPRLKVLVEESPGAPYTEYIVQTDNRDAVRFDLIRERKGWPKATDAPMVWMSVLAWHAIKRSGATTDDVETYLDKIVDLVAVDENNEPKRPDAAGRLEVGEAGPLA